ncbi:DUF1080 domain-containing protein [Ningiella sp. W23]|uniref:3-keto-disaccharide hydrolase n=1 Tax=Ningiella sp. W23 TaxID=3023715 RepID=UPI00375674F5
MMKATRLKTLVLMTMLLVLWACQDSSEQEATQVVQNNEAGFVAVFEKDLSNAIVTNEAWRYEGDELIADKDEMLWTQQDYDNFELKLEFKTGPETNSGVIVYVSDVNSWVQYSVEVQIADDHSEKWQNMGKTWQAGAIFGHKAASKSVINKPGEWNTMRVIAKDQIIDVTMNGEAINQIDLSQWTSAQTNPDGSQIPEWLSVPKAQLPTVGKIGFQGKHAGAPIVFRNIEVKEL